MMKNGCPKGSQNPNTMEMSLKIGRILDLQKTVGFDNMRIRIQTPTHPYMLLNQRQLEMWANAQRDGCPDEYRWCPLFNAAKFG